MSATRHFPQSIQPIVTPLESRELLSGFHHRAHAVHAAHHAAFGPAISVSSSVTEVPAAKSVVSRSAGASAPGVVVGMTAIPLTTGVSRAVVNSPSASVVVTPTASVPTVSTNAFPPIENSFGMNGTLTLADGEVVMLNHGSFR
jgi:hypothetical protein